MGVAVEPVSKFLDCGFDRVADFANGLALFFVGAGDRGRVREREVQAVRDAGIDRALSFVAVVADRDDVGEDGTVFE